MKVKFFILVLLVLTQLVNAQFKKLFEFPGSNDLKQPKYTTPVFDGTWLYAMTYSGGAYNCGTIFKVKPDGTGFTKMHDFDDINGKEPWGSLLLSEGALYGMTRYGGTNNEGVIFKIKTNGGSYYVIRNMAYGEANRSFGSLIISNGKLFGMSNSYVGVYSGCIFTVKTDGTGYKILHGFTQADGYPKGDLIIQDSILFGMTGSAPNPAISKGCIFKIDTTGNNYKNIHSFAGGTADGQNPHGSLVYANKKLYGMTYSGGSGNQGCVFTIDTAGTNYKHLWNFSGLGSYPYGSLTLNDSVLYGMASSGAGCLFKIDTTGNNFSRLLDFQANVTGYNPYGSLLLNDGILYGMTSNGGSGDQGNLFKIDITGQNFFQILDFNGSFNGKSMYGSLTHYNNAFYGMTSRGGPKNLGCIFKMNPDGTGYTRLMDFDSINGAIPHGDLLLVDDYFYGMTSEGGANNKGCIFKIRPDGTGYVRMADFDGTNHGANPYGSLVAIGDSLFGMNYAGGTISVGCIFTIKTDGTGFNKLVDFNGVERGSRPYGSLAVSNGVLYGMTSMGGTNGKGNLFRLNSDGTGFSTIINFNGTSSPYGSEAKYSTPVIVGNSLYAMTYSGATSNLGCIFKVDLTTNIYTNVANFNATGNGSHPHGSLTLYGKSLYGLACDGGMPAKNVGTIFKRDTLGLFNAYVHSFDQTTDGSNPYGSLINYNNELYGATCGGGSEGKGTIFKYTLTPYLQSNTITSADATISWTKGNGIYSAVFLKEDTGVITNPVDNSTYISSSDWTNKGTQLGTSGYYCIYNGTEDSVIVSGLNPLTKYTVRIFDFNGSNGTEQYFDTLASGNPVSFIAPKITPVITWNNPANITHGTFLSAAQLNATADVAGTFAYNPASGIKLNAGNNQLLQVMFTPTDASNYNTALKTVTIDVEKATPEIIWVNPADMVYGTLLDVNQLNATAEVSGTFVYNPASATKLNAGNSQSLQTEFTPADSANYNAATKAVTINVTKANPVITWNNPADITFGTLLDETQLNAAADVSGTFVYNPASATKLNAGNSQSLQTEFTPADSANYKAATKAVTINVTKANPVITWNNPADITFGTLLDDTQLNAAADVSGTFVYNFALGTKLNVGNNQSLQADFTPADASNYNTVSKTVLINVLNSTGMIHKESIITFYPNPVKDKLFILCNEPIESISIIDLSGVAHICITGVYKESELDLSALPDGIYSMKILTSTETIIYRIIKQ